MNNKYSLNLPVSASPQVASCELPITAPSSLPPCHLPESTDTIFSQPSPLPCSDGIGNTPPPSPPTATAAPMPDLPPERKGPPIEPLVFLGTPNNCNGITTPVRSGDINYQSQGPIDPIVFFDSKSESSPPAPQEEPPDSTTDSISILDLEICEVAEEESKVEFDIAESYAIGPFSEQEIESVSAELYQPLISECYGFGPRAPTFGVYIGNAFSRIPLPTSPPTAPSSDSPSAHSSEQNTKPRSHQYAQQFIRSHSLIVVDEDIYIYNGAYYKPISDRELRRMFVNMERSDFGQESTSQFRREILETIRDEPELAQNSLSADQNVVSFQNGIINLATGAWSQHDPRWITTYGLQCNYLSGNPETPLFDKFLADITGNDPVLTARIWQMIGYILSPDTRGKVFFLFQGSLIPVSRSCRTCCGHSSQKTPLYLLTSTTLAVNSPYQSW